MSTRQTIFKVDGKNYTWLREPLLMRLPDGSLFCEIYTGGAGDGAKGNIVGAVRSDDDGETWSELEVVKSSEAGGPPCWAASVFSTDDAAHIFWYTMDRGRAELTNYLLSTGSDGRTFKKNRTILQDEKESKNGTGIDIRRGTRNGVEK